MEKPVSFGQSEVITIVTLQEDYMKARIVRMGKPQSIHLPKTLLKKAKLGGDVELRAVLDRIGISKHGEA